MRLEPKQRIACCGTHGGAGYMVGTYWDGDDLICGGCGFRIVNPPPTGGTFVYWKFWEALKNLFAEKTDYGKSLGQWFRRDPKETLPRWPDWIGGTRGVKSVR